MENKKQLQLIVQGITLGSHPNQPLLLTISQGDHSESLQLTQGHPGTHQKLHFAQEGPLKLVVMSVGGEFIGEEEPEELANQTIQVQEKGEDNGVVRFMTGGGAIGEVRYHYGKDGNKKEGNEKQKKKQKQEKQEEEDQDYAIVGGEENREKQEEKEDLHQVAEEQDGHRQAQSLVDKEQNQDPEIEYHLSLQDQIDKSAEKKQDTDTKYNIHVESPKGTKKTQDQAKQQQEVKKSQENLPVLQKPPFSNENNNKLDSFMMQFLNPSQLEEKNQGKKQQEHTLKQQLRNTLKNQDQIRKVESINYFDEAQVKQTTKDTHSQITRPLDPIEDVIENSQILKNSANQKEFSKPDIESQVKILIPCKPQTPMSKRSGGQKTKKGKILTESVQSSQHLNSQQSQQRVETKEESGKEMKTSIVFQKHQEVPNIIVTTANQNKMSIHSGKPDDISYSQDKQNRHVDGLPNLNKSIRSPNKSSQHTKLPSLFCGARPYGDKIFDNQSATTLQKSILSYSMPKAQRFRNIQKGNNFQVTYYMGSCFKLENTKGTGFGYGTRKPYPQWLERNMKQIPAPGAYDSEAMKYDKGRTFGISYRYYDKVLIPKQNTNKK